MLVNVAQTSASRRYRLGRLGLVPERNAHAQTVMRATKSPSAVFVR